MVGSGSRRPRGASDAKAVRIHIHGPKSLLPKSVIVDVKNDQLNETWRELLTKVGVTIPTKWRVFVNTRRRADIKDGWRATLKDKVKFLIEHYATGNRRVNNGIYTVKLTYSTGEKTSAGRGARRSITSSGSRRIAGASSVQGRASTRILGSPPGAEAGGVRARQVRRESRAATRGSNNRTRRLANFSAVRAASILRTSRVRRNPGNQRIVRSSRISGIAPAAGSDNQNTQITARIGVRDRSAGSSGVRPPPPTQEPRRIGVVSNNQIRRGDNVTINSVTGACSVLVNRMSCVDNRRSAGPGPSRILTTTPPQAPQSAGRILIQPKVERDLDDGDNAVVQEELHNDNQAVVNGNGGVGVALLEANVFPSEDVRTVATRRIGRFSVDFVTRARDEMKQLQRNYLWDQNVANAPLASYLIQEILK